MKTLEFLSRLRKSGVELKIEGDRLRINAPEGILTPTLKAELIDRKEEIIEFLNSARSGNQSLTSILFARTAMVFGSVGTGQLCVQYARRHKIKRKTQPGLHGAGPQRDFGST